MRYLVWSALPFCAAAFVACLLPAWSLCFLFAAVAAVLFLFSLIGKKRLRRIRLLLVAAGACLGFLWFGVYTAVVVQPIWNLDGQQSAFSATVAGYPTQTTYGISLSVRMESGPAEGRKVLLLLDEDYDWLEPGDRLTGTATYDATDFYRDGENSGYASRGIFLTARAELSSAYAAESVPLRYFPARLGHGLKRCADALLEGDGAALLKGLMTGDKSDLSDAVSSDFTRSGLSHLMAVSGLHISFLTGILSLLPGNKRRRAFVTIPVLVCFALATGGSPSVWRAVVMSSLLLLAPVFRRETDAPTSLSFALLVLLIQNPYASLSVGLQLSFSSVAGLVLLQGRIYRRMMRPFSRRSGKQAGRVVRWAGSALAGSLSTSIAAILPTLPFVAYYFKTISLVAPLANLLCLWPASVAFALGLIACVLFWICPPLAELLILPVRWLLQWLMGVTSLLGRLPFSALRLDNFCYWGWFVSLLLLAFGVIACRGLRKRPLLPIASAAALLLLALTCQMAAMTSPVLLVSALDVGQGSCTVFGSDGSFVAVDCGGDDAGNCLADCLQAAGTNELSLLVLTHLDSDHVDGAEQLFRRVQVDALALGPIDDPEERETVVALAEDAGCELIWVDSTASVSFGEAEMTLFPPVDEGDNEGCISALCSWNDHNVLVTGDLPEEQEIMLLEREDLPQLDVLIVGHHGSGSSTSYELLAQLRPRYAIISVGEQNRYGHPSNAVLERLTQYRCQIYRTDQNGTVTIRFNE